jgi:copper chaperone CopZ
VFFQSYRSRSQFVFVVSVFDTKQTEIEEIEEAIERTGYSVTDKKEIK